MPGARRRAAMALSKLSGDEQGIVFVQLCNVLDPGVAVALSSVSNELWTATQALLPQLRADHEAATALCRKVGLRSCKELREAKLVDWFCKGLTAAELALLTTLGSVLSALKTLLLYEPEDVGDAGASALAAALGQGALPRLESLFLADSGIGDAGLVALAPALRRRPALETLSLVDNPFGDEGLAALLAPPRPVGAPPPPKGVLAKLKTLYLRGTQVSDAGCAALTAALDSGALPALEHLGLGGIPASAAAIAAVLAALARSRAARVPSGRIGRR